MIIPSHLCHTPMCVYMQAACLAKCNGANVALHRSGTFSLEEFRQAVIDTCTSGEEHLVVSKRSCQIDYAESLCLFSVQSCTCLHCTMSADICAEYGCHAVCCITGGEASGVLTQSSQRHAVLCCVVLCTSEVHSTSKLNSPAMSCCVVLCKCGSPAVSCCAVLCRSATPAKPLGRLVTGTSAPLEATTVLETWCSSWTRYVM